VEPTSEEKKYKIKRDWNQYVLTNFKSALDFLMEYFYYTFDSA
jgi:hypothetical protein